MASGFVEGRAEERAQAKRDDVRREFLPCPSDESDTVKFW
jgi:hypothetical protein